jgi:fumarylacetoacetate (FAA) hydrolase
MKLATYKDGSRDGQLVVVSTDLSHAHYASHIAIKLQQVLDDWNFISPQLEDLYIDLNHGKLRHAFPFDPKMCMAPLPRAYQWIDGSAYMNHIELVRAGRQTQVSSDLYASPLLYQGGSDDFIGPTDPILCPDEAYGIDFEAELAVITADVPMQTAAEDAVSAIRLVMLANDVTLRSLIPQEIDRGYGFYQSKPATSFSPVAVSVDELGGAWSKGRLHLNLSSYLNGRRVGFCEAGSQMTFGFGDLIAHACKTRNIRAGTIIGSGTVSNQAQTINSRKEWPTGYSCIAEKRAMELIQEGKISTEYLKYQDAVRIEMMGADGKSVFGAIDQIVAPLNPMHESKDNQEHQLEQE